MDAKHENKALIISSLAATHPTSFGPGDPRALYYGTSRVKIQIPFFSTLGGKNMRESHV